jgi:hypothetical protein
MDNVKFECKSSMDKRTRLKTAVVFLFFVSITAVIFITPVKHSRFVIFPIVSLLIYLIALIFGLYKTPISYKILNNNLLIISRFSKISINIQNIRSVRIFDHEDKRGLVRTFGAEGVIGNIGNYSSIKHKKMTILTSRDTNWILINTKDNKNLVISPDDLDLVNMININKYLNK